MAAASAASVARGTARRTGPHRLEEGALRRVVPGSAGEHRVPAADPARATGPGVAADGRPASAVRRPVGVPGGRAVARGQRPGGHPWKARSAVLVGQLGGRPWKARSVARVGASDGHPPVVRSAVPVGWLGGHPRGVRSVARVVRAGGHPADSRAARAADSGACADPAAAAGWGYSGPPPDAGRDEVPVPAANRAGRTDPPECRSARAGAIAGAAPGTRRRGRGPVPDRRDGRSYPSPSREPEVLAPTVRWGTGGLVDRRVVDRAAADERRIHRRSSCLLYRPDPARRLSPVSRRTHCLGVRARRTAGNASEYAPAPG